MTKEKNLVTSGKVYNYFLMYRSDLVLWLQLAGFNYVPPVSEIFSLSKAAPNVFGAYSECRNQYYCALRFVQKNVNGSGFQHQLKVCDFSEDANSSTMDVSFIVIF